MSLKTIDMQMSLHRTQEFGRMQEQLNQRAAINQHHDGEENKLKAELERQQADKAEGKKDALISSEDSPSREQNHESKEREKRKDDQVVLSSHPYKGKHIDISL